MRRFAADGPDGASPGPTRGRRSAGPDGGPPPLERLLRFFVAPPTPRGAARAGELPLGDREPRAGSEPCREELPRAGNGDPADGIPPAQDGAEAGAGGAGAGGAGADGSPPAQDGPVASPPRGRRAWLGDGDLRAGEVPLEGGDPRPSRAAPARAPRVAVIGADADVRAAARALASRLAARRGRPGGIVALWSAEDAAGRGGDAQPARSGLVPARAGAARLATALAGCGHDAWAAGRLVEVRLGEEPGAVAEAERVQDAAGDAPVVLALGGPRGEAWDRLLPAHDLVLLAAGPHVSEPLASVALALAQDRCAGAAVRMLEVSAGRRPRPSRADLGELVAVLEGR